jgi:hypothetical protein
MRTRSLLIALTTLATLTLATACGTPAWVPAAASSRPADSATAADTETAEDTPDYADPGVSDFTLSIKTKRKQCFGSAGCNVDIEPDLTYSGDLPLDPDKTYDITYQITGDEDGPVIDTITLTNGTDMQYYPSSLSTTRSGVKITGKVTAVEETG